MSHARFTMKLMFLLNILVFVHPCPARPYGQSANIAMGVAGMPGDCASRPTRPSAS
jgi:hypothetical protein